MEPKSLVLRKTQIRWRGGDRTCDSSKIRILAIQNPQGKCVEKCGSSISSRKFFFPSTLEFSYRTCPSWNSIFDQCTWTKEFFSSNISEYTPVWLLISKQLKEEEDGPSSTLDHHGLKWFCSIRPFNWSRLIG